MNLKRKTKSHYTSMIQLLLQNRVLILCPLVDMAAHSTPVNMQIHSNT